MMGHPPGASLHEGSEQSLHGLLPRFVLGGCGRGDHRIEAMIPKVNELASNKVVVVADLISTGRTVTFEGFPTRLQGHLRVVCRSITRDEDPCASELRELCLLGDARAKAYLGGDRCCWEEGG